MAIDATEAQTLKDLLTINLTNTATASTRFAAPRA